MVSIISGSDPDKRLSALARILKLLRESEKFDQVVSDLLENLKEELDYAVLWLGLYDHVQHHIVSQGYIAPQPHRLLKKNFTLTPGDLMEQVVIQQRPLRVNDLREESRIGSWRELADDLGIQGTLLFPIRRRDTCHGVLLLGSLQWGQTLDASDRTFISAVSSALADVLHQREQDQLAQQRKDPGSLVCNLVNRLNDTADCDDQLEAIARALLEFIEPDRVRIFWLIPTPLEFWERLTLYAKKKIKGPQRFTADQPGIALGPSDVRGVYQVLNNRQLLVVGESQGALIASMPDRFMQLLEARALMVAPIFHYETLLGFISVESNSPQVWSDAQREYLSTVAHLAGLSMPGSSAQAIRQQSDEDLQLLTGIVHSIQTETDWHKTLEMCSNTLCQKLRAQKFLVLSHDTERGGYNVAFQKVGTSRKKLSLTWEALDEVDWQMLERSNEAISINDLTHDLKLLAWRENFEAIQVKSLLACNVSPGNAPEGVVILTSESPRYWTKAEGDLLQKIAQQIGLILHQWQLQHQTDQQENLYDSIQWGLRTLQETFQPDQLEASACRHLIELLGVSMVALVTWQVGATTAQVGHVITRRKEFGVNQEAEIPIGSDAVINWALQTTGPLTIAAEDLPEATRQWFFAPPESKFLLVALRTSVDHAPNGVWLLADRHERKWTDHHLSLINLLVNQLAWSRRHLSVVDLLLSQREELQILNWYKHRRFEEAHRLLEIDQQRLSDPITQGKGLTAQRQMQLVRQLGNLIKGMQQVIDSEEWALKRQHQTTPLISLVNRLMERANPLIQTQHLWAKVHNDSNVVIGGDLEKIEFVLFEIMAAACLRSPEQGRLDIWCRVLDRNCLELSITDDGDLPDQLLTELREGRSDDILVPSLLDKAPGLHFSICQTLMQQLGGEFSLQKLKDGRIMSRIVLAISGKNKPKAVPLSP
ncbi:MAG: GAF domain-containing protein [Cyanobacteria bacterium J06639_14]